MNAQISFNEVKDGMRQLQLQQKKRMWDATKRFEQQIKKQQLAFQVQSTREHCKKKRVINQMFASKCRINNKNEKLSMAEHIKQELGEIKP